MHEIPAPQIIVTDNVERISPWSHQTEHFAGKVDGRLSIQPEIVSDHFHSQINGIFYPGEPLSLATEFGLSQNFRV